MKKSSCPRLRSMLLAGMLLFSTCQRDEDKPIILNVIPDSGRAGDAVVIPGLLLRHATRVTFGSVEGTVVAVEGKAVSTHVPAGLPSGKVNVIVETTGGVSNAIEFTVIPSIPEITAIVPAKGSPGMRVTLTGRYFSNVKEVAFGDQKIIAFDTSSDTQLVMTVPAKSSLGEKDVTATTVGGVSKKIAFTVVPLPTITSFTPAAGLTGTHVLISGANLSGITAIYFQDVAATFEMKSTTLIDVVVPAGAATGKLKVVGEGGDAMSEKEFVVEGAPVVSSFAPASGTITTEVIVNGDNFLAAAKVRFGNAYAKVTVVNEQQLKATVPAGATSASIVVETEAGTGKSSDSFSVIAAPSIASFTPNLGVAGTTKITLTGTNFKDISSVKFNGAGAGQANITVNSMTSLDVKVPALASTGTVEVTNPSGTGVSAAIFTVVDPSSAVTFSPASGPVGTSVTITGFGFDNTSVVKFNGTPVAPTNITLNSGTSLLVQVPASSTTGNITVATGSQTLTSAQSFVVVQPPNIASFSPTSGPAGTQVAISGVNFDNATVEFNGKAITTGVIVMPNNISFYIPTGSSSGTITIKTIAGQASTGNFAVIPPPQINSFSPAMGAIGSVVSIFGSSFDQATSVQFNGTEAGSSNFQVNSSNSITAKVPVGATTGAITVITPAGTYSTATSFTLAPAVTSFSPASGPIGTPVTITGANFANITDVFFDGTKAITVSVNSTTSIEATVPAGATTGNIAVKNLAGTGASTTSFNVTPTVNSISPTSGPVGTAITITGSGFTGVNNITFNNGVPAAFSVVGDTQITTSVPSTATSGDVTIAKGPDIAKTPFVVVQTPVVTSISPMTGKKNTFFTLYGANLNQVTQVTLGGTSVVIIVNLGSIIVRIPAIFSLGAKSIVIYSGSTSTNVGVFTVTN